MSTSFFALSNGSCDGTGGDGWRVETFIIEAGTDVSTLLFNQGFPPNSVGDDRDATDGTIRSPLFKDGAPGTTYNPFASPPGLINPTDLSAFNFSDAGWNLVDGNYQIGFICKAATGTAAPEQWWVLPVTIDTTPGEGSPFMMVSEGNPEPENTTIAVTADPASSTVGTEVTFTAIVSPSGAAGTVEFFVGGVSQATDAVSGGTASWTTSALTAGTKSITATFTPMNTAAFNGSTSLPLSHVVSPASAVATTLALTAAPPSQAIQLQLVTFTATVTPSAAAGTVTFSAGGEMLAADVPVEGGVATTSGIFESIGSVSVSATFTPSDSAAFTGSTGTLDYAVIASPGDPTTVTLASAPASQAAVGEEVTFTATVEPAVAGVLAFLDDGELLGDPVEVVDGVATYVTSDLAAGEHEITAAFIPVDLEAHAPSVSPPLSFVVGEPDPDDPPDPDPTTGGSTGGLTDVAGSGTGSLPLTGTGVGVAGLGLVLVYMGRVLYLVSRPRASTARR